MISFDSAVSVHPDGFGWVEVTHHRTVDDGPTTDRKSPMTDTPDLTDGPAVLRAIPAHLDAHGWCQGADHNNEGAACLRGAINDLATDPQVRSDVMVRLGLHLHESYVGWNDAPGRSVKEVKAAVLSAADIDLGDANLGGADLGGADLRGARNVVLPDGWEIDETNGVARRSHEVQS